MNEDESNSREIPRGFPSMKYNQILDLRSGILLHPFDATNEQLNTVVTIEKSLSKQEVFHHFRQRSRTALDAIRHYQNLSDSSSRAAYEIVTPESQVAGLITVADIDDHSKSAVIAIFLAPEMRKRGIAFTSISLILARCKSIGIHTVSTDIFNANADSQRLSEKFPVTTKPSRDPNWTTYAIDLEQWDEREYIDMVIPSGL